MRVIVRSEDVRLWLPIPMVLAGAAVALMPESALVEPYRDLLTKPLLRKLVRECRSVLKRYRGLEIVRVESQDGPFVSIRL